MVAHILNHEELCQQWRAEVDGMRRRLLLMREGVVQRLIEGSQGGDYRFLRKQKGMFGCLNLSVEQVHQLKEKFAVYLLDNGRFSLAGLNHKNVDTVVRAILSVCES